ncbi:MAG: hypothetical protein RR086_04105 [Clostridia bacterium]
MKSKITQKLIITTLSLIIALALMVSGVFAWFNFSSSDATTALLTGNVDLDVSVYSGRDNDKDGTLEPLTPNSPIISACSRKEVVDNYYTIATKNSLTNYQDIIQGNVLIFKLMVINENYYNTNASVSTSIAPFSNYFFSAVEQYKLNNKLVPNDIPINGVTPTCSLFNGKTGAILFELSNLTVSIYADNANNYGTLVSSSNSSLATGNVTLINGIKPSQNLWELSDGQNFVDKVQLNSKQLMEIDFKLTYAQFSDSYANRYVEYAKSAYLDRCTALFGNDSVKANAYLNLFAQEELLYCAADPSSEKYQGYDNYFSINYFAFKGAQIPNK